jgi:hypothetical protein
VAFAIVQEVRHLTSVVGCRVEKGMEGFIYILMGTDQNDSRRVATMKRSAERGFTLVEIMASSMNLFFI